MTYTTPCIRCGKMRVVIKTWEENTGVAILTHTETACPDKDCQKIVDVELQAKKDKLLALQHKSIERAKTVKRVKKS